MTHDELLKLISLDTKEDVRNALRAVVELHKPIGNGYPGACAFCDDLIGDDDSDASEYPCPTIQAIEKELG